VFATHRRTRLALGRGFTTLQAAQSYAAELRRERFHDRDAVIVIDDRTGDACALAPETAAAAPAVQIAPEPNGADDSGPVRFGVFTRFRGRPLALARRLPTVEAAFAFAERVRQHRFRDPEAVFVVNERTGQQVQQPSTSALDDGAAGGGELARSLTELSRVAHRVVDKLGPVAEYTRDPAISRRVKLAASVAGSCDELFRRHTKPPIDEETRAPMTQPRWAQGNP
jgi:hypothetical protein